MSTKYNGNLSVSKIKELYKAKDQSFRTASANGKTYIDVYLTAEGVTYTGSVNVSQLAEAVGKHEYVSDNAQVDIWVNDEAHPEYGTIGSLNVKQTADEINSKTKLKLGSLYIPKKQVAFSPAELAIHAKTGDQVGSMTPAVNTVDPNVFADAPVAAPVDDLPF